MSVFDGNLVFFGFRQIGAHAMLTDVNDFLLPVFRSISARVQHSEEESTGHTLSSSSWEDVGLLEIF